jgi:hypothetical protein
MQIKKIGGGIYTTSTHAADVQQANSELKINNTRILKEEE